MWETIISVAIGKAVLDLVKKTYPEYRLYIYTVLIILVTLAIIGIIIETMEWRKRKQPEKQMKKADIESPREAVPEYASFIQEPEEVEPKEDKGKAVARKKEKIAIVEVVRLQINRKNIIEWSQRYDNRYRATSDERTEIRLKRLLQNQSYLEKPDFIDLCMWKSPRPKRHYESNDGDLVKKTTRESFSTEDEESRIKKLMELKGVSWPVASAILHFAFPDKYPILDFRVIWSLGWKKPSVYSFNFWQQYCHKISQIAQKVNLPIRTVDKALWAYSKENQKNDK